MTLVTEGKWAGKQFISTFEYLVPDMHNYKALGKAPQSISEWNNPNAMSCLI